MELFLVRHGQSFNNALEDSTKRQKDPLLTAIGQRQAECVAQYLAAGKHLHPAARAPDRPPADALYCSAMHRTLQTTQPIAARLGMAPRVWVDLHEMGGIHLDHFDGRGPVGYPGLTRPQIEGEFADYDLPAEVAAEGWWQGGKESDSEAFERARRVVDTWRGWAPQDKRIIAVAHGGIIDYFLKVLAGYDGAGGMEFGQRNTAISHINFRADGHPVLVYMNRIEHLPDELII